MSSNTYLLSGIQGQAYKYDPLNSSLYLSSSWNYTLNCVHYQLKSSKSGNQMFEIVVHYDNITSSYSTDLNFMNPSSLISIRISITPHYCKTLMPNQNGIVFVLCQNANSINVLCYNQYGSLNGNMTENTIGLNYQIFVYNNHLGFSVDFQLFAYDANSFTKYWAYSFANTQIVTQITIFNAQLFALSNQKMLVQFHVGIGKKFDQILINQTHIRLFQNFSDVMVQAWSPGNKSLSFYSITNDYTCPGGCTSCWGGYCINATSLSCYVPVPTPPLPILPPAPPTVPTVPITPSVTNQIQNVSVPISKKQIDWCLEQDDNGYCYQTCSIQCLICKQQPNICVLCSEYYNLVEDGQCQLNFAINVLAFIYSMANTFRIRQVQTLYLLINNLRLYQFHSTKYNGVIDIVFQIANLIKERSWNLLPIKNVVQFLSTPIFWLKQYTPHTLMKFLEVQRANLTFLQNTKEYFLVYFPITFIIFLLLNRLFYGIFNYKISYIFRCYSFWLYFAGIIVLVDIHKLSFLSCIQLKNLYSFYVSSKWTQAVSVLLVGFWIAVVFAILPLYRYFYGNLDKYFYGNMKRIKYSLFVLISRSIAKPVIQGIAHACLLSRPSAQIVVLTFIQVIFFVFTAIFQVTQNLIKSKSIYCVEACIDLLMVLMNIVILIQYHDSQSQNFDQQAQKKLIQLLLKIIVIISSFLIGIDLILEIFQSFWEISRIRKRQNKFANKSSDILLNLPIYKQVGPFPSYKCSSFQQKIKGVSPMNSICQIQNTSENRRVSRQNKSIKIKLNKLTMFNIMIQDQIQETQQQKFN